MPSVADMTRARRPAADLIDAIVHNMRTNLEELRYTTIAPSHYTVYLSQSEYTRLEGILPRLQAETVRALDEELARLSRRSRLPNAIARWFKKTRPLEHADVKWHVEFLPDLDGELEHEQDIIVQSDLVLPLPPDLGGERTRRVTTVRAASHTTTREETVVAAPPVLVGHEAVALARLVYEDQKGAHEYRVTRDSTTIGRGGTLFPVDVRISASDQVSREHARLRREPTTGAFFLIDLSTHGTTIDGQPVARGYNETDGRKRENGAAASLPRRARIGLAGAVFLTFEQQP
ncbi:MAG: FhaA domain-containing protein [Vicinamibacterales bacterium]